MATVSNGTAALEQLSIVPIDLVILDVMMPHLNGFQTCEKIKANPETYLIPVILITSLSDKQDRIEGIKAGADDFLTRPVDRTELLARVRSLLKLKLRTDELERAESVLFTLARSIEGKDPVHARSLRAFGGVFRLFGRTSQTAGRSGYCSPACRRGSRHRKDRDTRCDYLEADQSFPRRMETHAGAPCGRGAYLRAVEVLSLRTANHSPPPRKV